ncbi:phosphoethanolamine transferase [Glaciimonas immobilis]|uniref:Heptose-I-phosphate ethanolaminephosphotransferase n=1 Tax=Glaciimonas immobilis TaxID=728004 RepID=A0A840RL01_9BURK|nr:phosphoethanolamine transferase [Glaciimonas immobilis]KAF3999433.1 sulfatase-like hydrolase/transferase [Glaciimonas immobilis]MBB5198937.1 heptose-I-phosphate ethanolaminephosphotransferase [Glaciimonas immobilis]
MALVCINPENFSPIKVLKNAVTRNILLHFIVIFLGLLVYDLGGVDMHSLLKKSALVFLFCIGPLNLLFCFQMTHRAAKYCSTGLAIIFFLDATTNYFLQLHYGLSPNTSIVWQSIFNTTSTEVWEFLASNWRDVTEAALIFVAVTGGALFVLGVLSRRVLNDPIVPRRLEKMVAIFFTMIVIALHFNPTMRDANPIAFWPIRYLEYQRDIAYFKEMQAAMKIAITSQNVGLLKSEAGLQRTVVLVIGESSNRDNWSLYGYPRKTTPKIDAIRNDIVVFRDVVSAAAYTQDALKMLLTPATLESPERWQTDPNVVMLAKSVGYKVFWLSNQTHTNRGDTFVSIITENADVKTFTNSGYRSASPQDDVLLPHVSAALNDTAPLKFIVVHLWGQHQMYSNRYPSNAGVFDSSDDAVAQSMRSSGRSRSIIKKRNEYDNAIHYGDQVLASLIGLVAKESKEVPTALLYVSDHGQEVGHNRDFAGHSIKEESGYTVPALLWVNAIYSPFAVNKTKLEKRPYQTDKMDTTLLRLLRISSENDQPQYDLLGKDFAPFSRVINGYPYQSGQSVEPA